MKDIKPIKRTEQLISLSREHHDALLFIWKIRQGLKNETAVSIISDYINWFWQNHLVEHFKQEEEILIPYLSKSDKLSMQLLKEHELIRSEMRKEFNKNSIAAFAGILDKHVRFEERELFPHIEKTVSMDELNEIGEQLNAAPHCDSGWENEFWKNKN
jgi:hemerythrin-like domain-containing protein